MVTDALNEREAHFRTLHENDSDEALIDYVRSCAIKLGHSPRMKEIDGSDFLKERFNTWDSLIFRAGLPKPSTPYHINDFDRVKKEIERKKKTYRRNKRMAQKNKDIKGNGTSHCAADVSGN